MKRFIRLFPGLTGILFPALAWAAGTPWVQTDIQADQAWDSAHSPYVLSSPVTVGKGAVLTVQPGTQVRFAPAARLVVRGGLEAVGEEGRPVYFLPMAGSLTWGGILFESSDPARSTLARCVVKGGTVSCRDASPLVQQCSLYGSRAAVAVGDHSSPRLVGNRVTASGVGLLIDSDSASPRVTRNTVYGNEYGVYIQRAGDPVLMGNLIYANHGYNIVNRSPRDIAAPWNGFQVADAGSIARTVYDGSRSPGSGRVRFVPFTPLAENAGTAGPAPAAGAAERTESPRLSLTLSGLYARAAGARVPAAQNAGLGNLLRLEYQFQPFLSLGVNAGYAAFLSNGKVSYVGQLDLMGRVIPLRAGDFEGYLVGGAGLNPLFNAQQTPWAGHYHALAGVGTQLQFSPSWGMTLEGVYDFYTPMAMHVDSFSLRLGISYALGL